MGFLNECQLLVILICKGVVTLSKFAKANLGQVLVVQDLAMKLILRVKFVKNLLFYNQQKQRTLLGSFFLSHKHVWPFFEYLECKVVFFPIDWKKCASILKVILNSQSEFFNFCKYYHWVLHTYFKLGQVLV